MSLAPIHRYIGRIVHLMRREKGMRQSELALLTGLKQPNLSRIENGLVSPRQVTLEKIAKALGVEVGVFYSESKVQEVERKWAASLGPKHAALLLAGKLAAVPLLESALGYPSLVSPSLEPQGQLEAVLQMPPIPHLGEHQHTYALRIQDDSMQSPGRDGRDDFRPGEVAVFASGFEVRPGDFAFVMLGETSNFRRVFMPSSDLFRLTPLNPMYQEREVPRAEVRQMWKLVRHIREY